MALPGKAGGPALCYVERVPLGAKGRQRGLAECPRREAFWLEVGEREEPSYSAMRRGPKPRQERRVRKAEVKCHLCLFSPLKTKQSSCVQWPLRKTGHFLRRYQGSPGIVPGFQQWPPLPDQHRSRSFCGAGSSPQSGLCAFHRAVLQLWCLGSIFCLESMDRKQN